MRIQIRYSCHYHHITRYRAVKTIRFLIRCRDFRPPNDRYWTFTPDLASSFSNGYPYPLCHRRPPHSISYPVRLSKTNWVQSKIIGRKICKLPLNNSSSQPAFSGIRLSARRMPSSDSPLAQPEQCREHHPSQLSGRSNSTMTSNYNVVLVFRIGLVHPYSCMLATIWSTCPRSVCERSFHNQSTQKVVKNHIKMFCHAVYPLKSPRLCKQWASVCIHGTLWVWMTVVRSNWRRSPTFQ